MKQVHARVAQGHSAPDGTDGEDRRKRHGQHRAPEEYGKHGKHEQEGDAKTISRLAGPVRKNPADSLLRATEDDAFRHRPLRLARHPGDKRIADDKRANEWLRDVFPLPGQRSLNPRQRGEPQQLALPFTLLLAQPLLE